MARYKYDRDGKLLSLDEKTGEWKRDRTKGKWDFSKPARLTYMPDIQPFVSVAGHRPELISSRFHLGRHERSNNMRQVGNDLKGHHVASTKRRHAADMALIKRESRRVRTDVSWSNVPDGRVLDKKSA